MPPIVLHQAKEYSQDIHHSIPLEWEFHHTRSGYMDRDRWLKTMTQFSNICGASPVSNKILLFGGHDSHFNDCALTKTTGENIQPFVLKAGDSINKQSNGNGPNSKLKALYKTSRAEWILKYGTLPLQPHHMNSVLFETWEAFKLSAVDIIS